MVTGSKKVRSPLCLQADDIVVKENAKKTLDRFCQWTEKHQRPSNPFDSTWYDVAVFLTRENIGPAGNTITVTSVRR